MKKQRGWFHTCKPGLEVIELEFILRLKIKHNDWLLVDTCPQAANHYALFESETVLKFYNLRDRYGSPSITSTLSLMAIGFVGGSVLDEQVDLVFCFS